MTLVDAQVIRNRQRSSVEMLTQPVRAVALPWRERDEDATRGELGSGTAIRSRRTDAGRSD
jgi:hypothetical protein